MSLQWLKTQAAAVGVAALLAMSAGHAEAALVSCGPGGGTNLTGKVHDGTAAKNVAASDCQFITPADAGNVASISNINDAAFFGTSTWAAVTPAQTQVDQGETKSGLWSIPGADFDNFDYMIVFKDGGATNLTGLLLNGLYASGGWDTPFTDPPFNLPGATTQRDVSHLTIVQRATDTPPETVPEPGVLGLLGLGLVGLGLTAYSRRRRIA